MEATRKMQGEVGVKVDNDDDVNDDVVNDDNANDDHNKNEDDVNGEGAGGKEWREVHEER